MFFHRYKSSNYFLSVLPGINSYLGFEIHKLTNILFLLENKSYFISLLFCYLCENGDFCGETGTSLKNRSWLYLNSASSLSALKAKVG